MPTLDYTDFSEKRSYFTSYFIHTFDELCSFVKCVCFDSNFSSFVFRGMKEAKYKCYSSAQLRTKGELNQEAYVSKIKSAIQAVRNSEFIMNYLDNQSCDKSDLQILALMQHYGCGTPIIDYTTSILNALFFATDRCENTQGTVDINDNSINSYISILAFDLDDPNHVSIEESNAVDADRLRYFESIAEETHGPQYRGLARTTLGSFFSLPFDELSNLGNGGLFSVKCRMSDGIYQFCVGETEVKYDISNERVDIQEGVFIFNANCSEPYETLAQHWHGGTKNYCINIHKSLEKGIKQCLYRLGITTDYIYPKTELSKKIIEELRSLPISESLKPKKSSCIMEQ